VSNVLVAVLSSSLALAAGASAAESARVPNPIVTPAAGGYGQAIGGLRYDVGQFGYEEREYYFEGTARSYVEAPLPPAPYRSRMIVWTPIDRSRFNGTTVVEWSQVSDFGHFELTVALNAHSPMLEERGYAFVLVSAEERGVCHRGRSGCKASSLKGADAARYGSLDHPGDAYSFDIFNQALQAIKHPSGLAPLGKLRTRILIVEGFQRSIDKWFPVGRPYTPLAPTAPFSAYGPLNDYLANGADDDARLADAFLIDGSAPALEPERYRVPTLHHLDESAIRRTPTPDGPNHVTWEIAGAAHADRWAGKHVEVPSPEAPEPKLTREAELALRDEFDGFGLEPDPSGATCRAGPRTGSWFPRRFTLNAALVALRKWARKGVRAPAAPRIERVEAIPEEPTEKLRRDADGNAIGGLRSPIIQVPAAAYDGEACVEAGTTIAFPPARTAELYPSHERYVRALLAATNKAVAKRVLLCGDAETIMRKASASTVGGTDPFTAVPRCARRRSR